MMHRLPPKYLNMSLIFLRSASVACPQLVEALLHAHLQSALVKLCSSPSSRRYSFSSASDISTSPSSVDTEPTALLNSVKLHQWCIWTLLPSAFIRDISRVCVCVTSPERLCTAQQQFYRCTVASLPATDNQHDTRVRVVSLNVPRDTDPIGWSRNQLPHSCLQVPTFRRAPQPTQSLLRFPRDRSIGAVQSLWLPLKRWSPVDTASPFFMLLLSRKVAVISCSAHDAALALAVTASFFASSESRSTYRAFVVTPPCCLSTHLPLSVSRRVRTLLWTLSCDLDFPLPKLSDSDCLPISLWLRWSVALAEFGALSTFSLAASKLRLR